MTSFDGHTVLITGASSGIGRAAALAFAERGASVLLVARRLNLLESLADIIRDDAGQARAICCDVADQESVDRMACDVQDTEGYPDVVVNNAGYALFDTVLSTGVSDIESQMNVNYMGMVRVTKAFLPGMIRRASGHIVNVASVAASFGLPRAAPYCASKFAMLGFSEGLRHELSGTGVGVTVVSPITVRTEFFGDDDSIRAPYAIRADTVARAILRAASSRRAEIVVPGIARLAISARHIFPYVTDWAISRIFQRYMSDSQKH